MVFRHAGLIAVAVLSCACGGGSSPPPPASAPASTGAPAAPAAEHKTLAEYKRDFMSGCSEKVPDAPDYCECGWEQMTKLYSEAEMGSADEDKAKVAQLGERIKGACRSKLPEPMLKAQFLKACGAGDAPLGPYCECTWGEYRKKLSAAEINDADAATMKTERFVSVRKAAAKTCGAKLPEDAIRDGFLAGCSKGVEARKPWCGCAWKTLRAKVSVAEIAAGLLDMEAEAPRLEKACPKTK